jgi:Flp pilus assembly protein TadG
MAFVAITMVAIISMAALSIDIGTLYEAKAEAQRAADAAALAAAQVISMSGITTDPTNGSADGSWSAACGASGLATLAATNVADQNLIGGNAPSKVTVNYGTSAGVGSITDCTGLGAAFGVNPVVQVYVQQAKLPTFFARIFSLIPGGTFLNSGVSATAAAEAFNPSGTATSTMIPVQPRCVKPWMVPNLDPRNGTCTTTCPSFVDPTSGAITNGGLSPTGVVGETFSLVPDCGSSGGRRTRPCTISEPPQAKRGPPPTLDYVPGQVSSASIAIAANSKIAACSEASRNDYTKAVAGCDQTTVYACGVSGAGNAADLTEDPGPPRNDSANAAECLINADGAGADLGQDVLAPDPAGPPYNYPFQINAGTKSALVTAGGLASGSQISSSPSIVSLPIYDNTAPPLIGTGSAGTIPVTIVGFLQVFINSVGSSGNITVTVMNVAGCGNSAASQPVYGTSPVPVRLITPPVATP